MRRWSSTLLFSCLIALVPMLGSAQDLAGAMDTYLKAQAAVNQFRGSVLVARDGRVVFERGYGPANAEWDAPNTPQTKFRLGSVTKQFTAAAVLLLQEQGKLSVQDPVCRFIAPCPPAWKPVTLHHLLTHTSGIPNFTDFPDYVPTMTLPSPPPKTVERFRDRGLEFEPGSTYKYSNSGYLLLGLVIEKASGRSYAAFVSERIFTPLGMADSGYDDQTAVLPRRATGYEKGADGIRQAAYIDMSIPGAAGGLYSTVGDMLKWDQALAGDRLLSAASRQAMFTPFKQGYAYGWTVPPPSPATFGRRQIAHGGQINGFSTFIARYPDDRVTVIVLGNISSDQPAIIARSLAAIVFGEKYEVPVQRTVVPVDPAVLDTYVGQYTLAPNFVLTVTREGRQLFAQATGQPRFEVFPESPVKFFLRVVDAQITFTKGTDGAVTGLVLHQNGRDMPASRVR